MTTYVIPVERGCGVRQQGAIYGECGLSPWGRPLEAFLMDPPVPVDGDALGLSPVGVTLIDDAVTGATHVLDWVGESSYQNIADFLEEVRRFGLSRRLPRTIDFSRLDSRSRIMLVHRKAIVVDVTPYTADWGDSCPRSLPEHAHLDKTATLCAGIWWEDITGGVPYLVDDARHLLDPRGVTRTLPSFQYSGRQAPKGVIPTYAPGIFASFPLSRLVVIADPDGGTHEEALEHATLAGLPVDLEDA